MVRWRVFTVGDTLGDYKIVSELKRGGMATLFLGERIADAAGPPVAIKAIHESLSADWQFVRMFIDEALISVRIRHPNVVRVDELGEQDNTYFLAMEYVEGCSLAELLRAMGRQGRRMRPEIALFIASEVAAGLHAAHEMTGHDGESLNVVHRDVSPQNVLLALDGGVKLLDFGIAKAAGRAERTEAGVIKGKVRYMSPEQARGETVDRRVDIYALGVVLWEMLTMRRYIVGRNDIEIIRKVRKPERIPPSERAPGIDPRIDEAVLAALHISPGERPPTAAAFQAMLAAAIPETEIGNAHVSELLRMFVQDEIVKAAEALPADVASPIVKKAREATPLPGDADGLGMDEATRTQTLTTSVPKVDLSDVKPPKEVKKAPLPEPQILQPPPHRPTQKLPPLSDGPATYDQLPAFPPSDDTEAQPDHELVQRVRAEASAKAELRKQAEKLAERQAPYAEATRNPVAEIVATRTAPALASSPSTPAPKERSTMRLLVNVILVTLVAFGLGAAIAIAYVRFMQP